MQIPALTGSEGVEKAMRWFAVYTAACVVLFSKPLLDLIRLSLSSSEYSHILVVPAISAALIYAEREAIFRHADSASKSRASLILVAFAGAVSALILLDNALLNLSDGFSLRFSILVFVVLLWCGFAWLFGGRTFRAGLFPLALLLLMLPPPGFLLDRVIVWLQWGSADVANWLFRLTMTPSVRNGLTFVLPGVTIEVAPECSGIRSSIALGITCLAACYLFLRMDWTRAAFMLAVLPVVVLKNGIRIATLSLLAIRVDPSFLFGRLHHDGGIVFFAVGLAMMLGLLRGLQRIERWVDARQPMSLVHN